MNFSGGIAHDFNNLMSNMGYTELSLGIVQDHPVLKEHLKIMVES
ncbi:hypothetical protein [Oceanispirochaeta sp.]|nr:hypothetical protein [Oceanispirochaeta sp.]MDA3956714.1 hypothetical protein [Oceanispirochaeta sp.]